MGITDELRSIAAKTECASSRCEKLYRVDLERIADRIDAAHEGALVSSYFDGVFSDGELAENGFIRLPVDADGEYIHMGDVMESRTGSDLFPQFEVRVMRYDGDRWEVIDRLGDRYEPSGLRHYHEPTVEDMLWELLGDIRPDMEDEEAVQIVAAYAKRLRLADGEE